MRLTFPVAALLLAVALPAAALELASPEPIVLKTPGRVYSLWAGNEGRVAASADHELWVWGPGPGKIETVIGDLPYPIVAITPDGRFVAAGAREGSFRMKPNAEGTSMKIHHTVMGVWHAKTSELAAEYETGNRPVISADGRVAGFWQTGFYEDRVRFRDLPDGKERSWKGSGQCKETGSGFHPYICEGVSGLALSPDGSRALVARVGEFGYKKESPVLVIDTKTGKKLRGFDDCGETLRDRWADGGPVAYSPDGRFLAHGGGSQYEQKCDLVVREADTGVLLWRTSEQVRSVAFTGSVLVAVSAARKLVAWDAATGKPEHVPEHPSLSAVSAAPDGSFLFLDADDKILAYKLKPGVGVAAAAAPAAPTPEPKPEPVEAVDPPPASKTPVDPEALAIVIGIEKYRQAGIPGVEFAASDARTVHSYLTKAMGFDPRNVVLLTDEQATKSDLEKYLGPWLENRVTAKSRVFVYFAGHGSPDPKTGAAYLMPYEGDPAYTKVSGYPLASLYKTLAELPTRDVVVALDSCFSGAGQRSVIAAGARPLVNVKAAAPQGTTVVLAAAAGDQISGSYPEGRHGLMTYFMLKGLRGAADQDKDGAVTTRELYSFVRPSVEREARKANREQTPLLQGLAEGASGPVWVRLR